MTASAKASPEPDDRSAASALEIVLHVPKCAGSTIERHLSLALGQAAFWSPPRRRRGFPQELLARKYVRASAPPVAGVRAVGGHYVGRSVEEMFADRRIRRSVLLRKPADLVLSWYNYRMMRYQAKGRPTYPFDIHLKSLPSDPLTHFLLATWLETPWTDLARMRPAEKYERVAAALDPFDFIGDIKDCDTLVRALSERLSIPAEAESVNTGEDWSARSDWTPVRAIDLGDAERAQLARRTRIDQALFARFVLGDDAPFDARTAASFPRTELSRPLAELRRRIPKRAR